MKHNAAGQQPRLNLPTGRNRRRFELRNSQDFAVRLDCIKGNAPSAGRTVAPELSLSHPVGIVSIVQKFISLLDRSMLRLKKISELLKDSADSLEGPLEKPRTKRPK